MTLTKGHKIIISLLIIAGLLIAYIVIDRKSGKSPQTQQLTNTSTSTSIVTSGTGTTSSTVSNVEGTGNYTVQDVSTLIPKPIPDLNRGIVVTPGAYITPEATTVATAKVKELQTALKTNPSDVKSWINLGIYQKMAGDYAGAIISWKYAGRLAPNDYVSFGNLGNLYAYFLKDSSTGEKYYLQAIANGPTHSYLYIQLAEMYRDIASDTTKAKAIIDQGLIKIPNDPMLLQFKATLQ